MNERNERIAIVEGIRTPFCKAGGVLKDLEADDLGAFAVKELLARSPIKPEQVDELIFGNVLQPSQMTNIARILAVKGGLPVKVPAYTINRNCSSGMEAITSAANQIRLGHAEVVIAGGTESMSNFQVVFKKKMRDFLQKFSKAKSWKDKLGTLFSFRLHFFYPEIPEMNDPLCSLSMGQTAEVIARELIVTRKEQDEFALLSQERASKALKEGKLAEEIVPIPIPPAFNKIQTVDDGPRANQTLAALTGLKPVFDKLTGTVTAGNSSQITDGAAALLLMSESKAKELGVKPLGYIKDYASAGLDPSRMGLGPVYAISKLLARTNMSLNNIDLFEINEAFAGQVVAVEKALASDEFAKKELGRERAIGKIDRDKLNVNGGAVALGHPLGASGARLVLTLLKELNRQGKKVGLATMCVGGGQGEAVIVETV
jgi:acetyl-CoA acyltransferase